MPDFAPVFLPSDLVVERKLDLTADFAHAHTWPAFLPGGGLCMVSGLFYNYSRYDEADSREYGTYIASFYDADLRLVRQAGLEPLRRAVYGADGASYTSDWLDGVTLTPRGQFLFTTSKGRAFVYDAELSGELRRYDCTDWADRGRVYRENLASLASVTPGGRLLALVAEAKRGMAGNVLALSAEPSPDLAVGQPILRYLASLEAGLPGEPHPIPYVRLPDGSELRDDRRPSPSLVEASAGWLPPLARLYSPLIRQILALDEDRSLVLATEGRIRKRSAFLYLLLGPDGAPTTHLDLGGDTPFIGYHVLAAHLRGERCLVVKTRAQVHLFDEEGAVLGRIPVESDPALTPLRDLQLLSAAPDGTLFLVNPKHHALLRVPGSRDLARMREHLAAAAWTYPAEHRAAKKRWKPVNNRWVV